MISYKDAGVDIDFGNNIVDILREDNKRKYPPWVKSGIGGFNSIINLINSPLSESMDLVLSTDGVGTKLLLASEYGFINTIGIDLVAMSVNDVLCSCAKPIGFLDYISFSELSEFDLLSIISGIEKGCYISKCPLVGGETAQMPGLYNKGEFDLAGFAVGIRLGNDTFGEVKGGDALIGISSSGFHSNGYSLIRKIIEMISYQSDQSNTIPIRDIMEPTKIYNEEVLLSYCEFKKAIHGIAHITGGGLVENTKRVIPSYLNIEIYKNSWKKPNVYNWLESLNMVVEEELDRTFNRGIGMVFVVDVDKSLDFLDFFKNNFNETAYIIGEVY